MTHYRIQAIDRFRGMSILYMIFGHSVIFWLRPQDEWFQFFGFVSLEVIGANLFIMLAGISLSFSYHTQKKILSVNPSYSPISWMEVLIPILWLSGMAMGMNIIGSMILVGYPVIWIWNVLLTIAVARLLCYPTLRLGTSPWIRAGIGVAFFLLSDPLRFILTSGTHYILFSTEFDIVLQVQPFPFFGFLFIGSALGDWLNSWRSQARENGMLPSQNLPIKLVMIGFFLIGFGILIGFQSSTFGIAFSFFTDLGVIVKLLIEGLPIFLIRGTGPWSFYGLGIQLVILGFFLMFDVWRLKKQLSNAMVNDHPNINSKNGLIVFGQTSLTLYLMHNLIYFMFANSLTIPEFFIWFSIIILGIYAGMWYWSNRVRMVGTLEWVIQYTTTAAIRKVYPNLVRK